MDLRAIRENYKGTQEYAEKYLKELEQEGKVRRKEETLATYWELVKR